MVTCHEVIVSGQLTTTADVFNVWENGLLVRQTSSVSLQGKTVQTEESFTYVDGLCTEMHSSDGKYDHYFTYTYGRLSKVVYVVEGSVLSETEILSYSADGFAEEVKFTIPETGDTRKYFLTWQNGDLVKAVVKFIGTDQADVTYSFSYDSYPSAYTGYPVGTSVDDVESLALRGSRHNLMEKDWTPVYENGCLVSLTEPDGSKRSFTYLDGTGAK